MRTLRVFFTASLVLSLLAACGGSDGDESPPPPPPAEITVSLSTATPAIQVSQTAQFTATVTGTSNTQVTYSVDGGAGNGSISTTGVYTAPGTAGTFTVRATSAADPSKSATATITVAAPPAASITITPTAATVATGGSVALSTSMAATFAVTGGNANGTVAATGPGNASYTAPATPGVYQVVATATADPSKQAVATITVSGGSGFALSANVRIAPGTTAQLTAALNGQPVTANWSILGTCNGCSITPAGLFTAGSTVQSVTVQGSNAANPAQMATTIVTIATEVVLTLNAPTSASLTWADMLTFNAGISPSGIENGVLWTTTPAGAGAIFNVDYFFGWAPPATPGGYTITGASVADPTKTGSFTAQVTEPPTTALVATAGAPASGRYLHAAAAMPDGRIVLVGGQEDRRATIPVVASSVFDPQAGTFTAGPSLAVARLHPEAIAIDATRVLVSGGQEEWNVSRNTAEVLNVGTGVASATANTMGARRIHHQMVRLTTGPNSGKVLVIGGFNGPVPYGDPTWMATNSVDLFDPATNTFTAAGATLKTSRGFFTATALNDGRILVVGGYEPDPGAGTLASAEIYDPVANTFTFTGSMAVGRTGHTATRLADGKVLVAGGGLSDTAAATAEIYDPVTGTFSAAASGLVGPRIYHAAAAVGDGRVVLFGGEYGSYLVRGTVEVFDPASRTFSLFARMGTARARATATPITAGPSSGKVLVFGGGARNTPAVAAELTP
jgi:hypothetical protein